MKHTTVRQLSEMKAATVIDVREDDEFRVGHIPGAVSFPLSRLSQRVGELPSGELFVVCQSGGRSAQATAALSTAGFSAVNVDGGTSAWIDAGLPIETQ